MHGWAGRDEGGIWVGFLGAAFRAAPPVWRRPPRGVGRTLALALLLLGGTAGALDAHAVVEGTMIDAGVFHSCAVGPDGALACWGWDSEIYTPPEGTFSQVSADLDSTCAVRTDGTLACWGYNTYGQASPPAGTFSQVSVGTYHSCGVRTDGTIACWGTGYDTGVVTPPTGTFSQVSAGYDQTCALRTNGTIACWGYEGDLYAPADTFSQVSAGDWHTCAVRTDGTLACWGLDGGGQATPPAGTFSQVSAGGAHTCAVRTDGTLACWGYNYWGQATPPAGTFSQVSAAADHTCAVRTDGTLACWGGYVDPDQATPPPGTFSQVSADRYFDCALGTNGTLACWGYTFWDDPGTPAGPPPAGTFSQVSATDLYACALGMDGTLACWGDFTWIGEGPPAGTFSQVSAGATYTCAVGTDGSLTCWGANYPGETPPPVGTFSQVSAGDYYTCAVRTDGTLACWIGDYSAQTTPTGTFSQVSAGGMHICAVRTNGTLTCWGDNSYGNATPPAGTFSQVSAGYWHTCAVRTDGTLACWGLNNNGQATPPAGRFTDVSVGEYHTCAVRDDGFLVCWGYNGPAPRAALAPSCCLPDATVGVAYAERFQGSGGVPPYSYTVVAGSLPPGLTLSSDGLLTGRPTELGSYAFTVRVADALPYPLVAEIAYTLDTVEPLVPIAKIGVWRPSTRRFLLDSNGNGKWEGTAGGDTLTAAFGLSTDLPVTGDWNGDGKDEVGVWRPGNRKFLLDSNGNNTWDGATGGDTLTASFGLSTDIPVTGDWNGDGKDEVGVWRPGNRKFMLDSNASNTWDGTVGGDTLTAAFGVSTDLPVAGDWNGDGTDDIGVWRPSLGKFLLDSNGSYTWDGTAGDDTLTAAFGLSADLPVAGDWNGDGTDEIGVWRPSLRKFLLDSNGNNTWDGADGADTLSAPFGLSTDLPVAGRW